MIKEAIDRILSLAAPTVAEYGGITYSSGQLMPVELPAWPMLHVKTLTGFADAIAALRSSSALAEAVTILTVESPTKVTCMALTPDLYGRRQIYVAAAHEHQAFQFGQFLSPEQMVIGLRSKFVAGESDDLAYVCQMVGNISNETAAKTEDDGVSQTIAVRRGISLKGVETLKPIVYLTGWRTFTEVQQPQSPFLFRARSQGNETTLALIEADGGAWRVQAAASIADWLKQSDATKDILTVR